ncbi:hypothetical protein B0H14DRAFT_3550908 [Mycena olivaceomarginata]|nr:hypothetical protein B0H14DRAFT_3550908 [Mycena olivaceomarginata]
MPPSAQCSHHVSVQSSRSMRARCSESTRWRPSRRCLGGEIATNPGCRGGEQLPKQSLVVEDVDRESVERFAVPCDPTFDIPPHVGRAANRYHAVEFQSLKIPWIDNLPLMTVQRTLYLLFPQDTANWSFLSTQIARISGPGKPTMYDAALGPVPRDLIIVLFQPPWVLSEQDIHEFSGFERQVWDTYAISKTRCFVLDVLRPLGGFGVFSEVWVSPSYLSVTFVLALFQLTHAAPTILELLVFWVACAMRLPGGCRIPIVAPEGTEQGVEQVWTGNVVPPLNSAPHPPAPTDDFDFLASQQSSGSDDQAHSHSGIFAQYPGDNRASAHGKLKLVVAASREKKRKEQEKKFFQIAKNKLTAEISAATDEVRSTIETTTHPFTWGRAHREKAYTKFILDYAALEDTIRALWMEIKKEEQTLIEIAKKQRIANDACYPVCLVTFNIFRRYVVAVGIPADAWYIEGMDLSI